MSGLKGKSSSFAIRQMAFEGFWGPDSDGLVVADGGGGGVQIRSG
jgi:hypothetical protein